MLASRKSLFVEQLCSYLALSPSVPADFTVILKYVILDATVGCYNFTLTHMDASIWIVANLGFVSYQMVRDANEAGKSGFGSLLSLGHSPGKTERIHMKGPGGRGEVEVAVSRVVGLSAGVIAGISIVGVAGVLLLAVCIYVGVYKKKKVQDKILLSARSEHQSIQAARAVGSTLEKATDSTGIPGGASSGLTSITVYDMVPKFFPNSLGFPIFH
ncbi:hypothetical protein LOK49_LG04G00588 [Camellia lanceoleosa]|uniref:Uncharacterized protein n=1 Tax=Camellia lanceoleosa TaxID=1840588 RepID=A0ACC0HZ06_9ERIC|nr:hypothetical protein LOK49_LG04G00588 [Camellia lanceoleosa]